MNNLTEKDISSFYHKSDAELSNMVQRFNQIANTFKSKKDREWYLEHIKDLNEDLTDLGNDIDNYLNKKMTNYLLNANDRNEVLAIIEFVNDYYDEDYDFIIRYLGLVDEYEKYLYKRDFGYYYEWAGWYYEWEEMIYDWKTDKKYMKQFVRKIDLEAKLKQRAKAYEKAKKLLLAM